MTSTTSVDEIYNEYLKTRFDGQLVYYDKKAKWYKKTFYISFFCGVFVLQVSPTVLWMLEDDFASRLISTIITTFVTLINIYMSSVLPKPLWLRYRNAWHTLICIQAHYKYKLNGYFNLKSDEAVRKFIHSVETFCFKETKEFTKLIDEQTPDGIMNKEVSEIANINDENVGEVDGLPSRQNIQ